MAENPNRMTRASGRYGRRSTGTKSGPKADPKFIEAFLTQGWSLLGQGRDEEATDIAIRIIRICDNEETRAFFLNCLQRWRIFPGAEQIRDVIARSWREAWAKPQVLFSITKGIFQADTIIGPAMQRATAAWPQRVTLHQLLGPNGLAQISMEPLLATFLERGSIFDLEIERFLTSLRAALLDLAMHQRGKHDENVIQLCCALARQCYINEYVFDLTADENELAYGLRDRIADALEQNSAVWPIEVAMLAAYMRLDCLPQTALLKRSWLKSVAGLLEEQILAPATERKLTTSIPQITSVIDAMSLSVQQQYEQNPFPRWVKLQPNPPMPNIDEWMPKQFPFSAFRKIGKGAAVDMLIAGCGTGQHSIMFAQVFPWARILAVDLSMASLCYAKAKTLAMGIENIEYAQGDILELPTLDRRFDVISSSGVLHHLAEPERGWRALLSLLRSGGCMHIGVYSERAHRNLIRAQRWLQERGFTPAIESVRQARQQLIIAAATDPALASVLTFTDFYCASEFRDLFLPTQMHRFTIPKIKGFLNQNGLEFLGFNIRGEIQKQFWLHFSRHAEADLSAWEIFESQHPDTFAGMYEFWVQKKPS